jgi:hypothetical protein
MRTHQLSRHYVGCCAAIFVLACLVVPYYVHMGGLYGSTWGLGLPLDFLDYRAATAVTAPVWNFSVLALVADLTAAACAAFLLAKALCFLQRRSLLGQGAWLLYPSVLLQTLLVVALNAHRVVNTIEQALLARGLQGDTFDQAYAAAIGISIALYTVTVVLGARLVLNAGVAVKSVIVVLWLCPMLTTLASRRAIW